MSKLKFEKFKKYNRNIWHNFYKINKNLGAFMTETFIGQIIIGLLLAIAISFFSGMYSVYVKDKDLLTNVNCINIGSSRDYMIEKFGQPMFEHLSENKIQEDVYVVDYAIVRAYYCNNQLYGYFVTLKESGCNKVTIPKPYRKFVLNKSLGNFTFSDTDKHTIYEVTSYVSNGIPYTFYSEKQYYGSSSNYYYLFFMYLDYGIDKIEFADKDEDKVKIENDNRVSLYLNREKSYPNTYGICDLSYCDEIYNSIQDYRNFDWISLKNND